MDIIDMKIVKGQTGLEIRTTVENNEFFHISIGFLIHSHSHDFNETINFEFDSFKDGFAYYDDEELNKLIDWKKLESQWKELFRKALYDQTTKELGEYFKRINSFNIPEETILRVYKESISSVVVDD